MATIQVRDLPEDVAEVFRRRADLAGQSLQAYMRELLIETAQQRDKTEVMAALQKALADDPGPGLRKETISSALRELRDE